MNEQKTEPSKLSRLVALRKRNSKIAATSSAVQSARDTPEVKDTIAEIIEAQEDRLVQIESALHALRQHLGLTEQDFAICLEKWVSDELYPLAMKWMDEIIIKEGLIAERDKHLQFLREDKEGGTEGKTSTYIARRLSGVSRCDQDDQWIVDQVGKLPARERAGVLVNYSLIYNKTPQGNRQEANLFLCDAVEKASSGEQAKTEGKAPNETRKSKLSKP